MIKLENILKESINIYNILIRNYKNISLDMIIDFVSKNREYISDNYKIIKDNIGLDIERIELSKKGNINIIFKEQENMDMSLYKDILNLRNNKEIKEGYLGDLSDISLVLGKLNNIDDNILPREEKIKIGYERLFGSYEDNDPINFEIYINEVIIKELDLMELILNGNYTPYRKLDNGNFIMKYYDSKLNKHIYNILIIKNKKEII